MTWQILLSGIVMAAMSASSRADDALRPVIYQLMVRTFGTPTRPGKPTAPSRRTAAGNSPTSRPPRSIRSNKWVSPTSGHRRARTGERHAYPNRPADDPDILKGIAGSPYAIKDYFDVCPDYAVDPDKRIDEFKELLERCQEHGFKVIIDFVPNHVARSYQSDVRPEQSFGAGDDLSVFFAGTIISTISSRITRAVARRSNCRPPGVPAAREIRAGDRNSAA